METEILEILQKQGVMMSEKRVWIVEAICEAGFIKDVEDFWLDLRATRPISWSTLHSTLRLMSMYGILERENRGSKSISYRLIPLRDRGQ